MPVPVKMPDWNLGRSAWYARYGVAVVLVMLALRSFIVTRREATNLGGSRKHHIPLLELHKQSGPELMPPTFFYESLPPDD
jgi:hypothetical protein